MESNAPKTLSITPQNPPTMLTATSSHSPTNWGKKPHILTTPTAELLPLPTPSAKKSLPNTMSTVMLLLPQTVWATPLATLMTL